MPHELQLTGGLPETSDSLAWSELGDLSVILAAKVTLFLPKRKATTQTVKQPGFKPWITVTLSVNNFSIAEWPNFEQRPYEQLSIGEELSDSHVVSCSWSLAGLAPDDRCALGILTANGLFSVWDAARDPSFESSWIRRLVANAVLVEHFGIGTIIDARRSRIRAAAWARNANSLQARSDAEMHLLALLNDHGEIVILQVNRVEAHEGNNYEANVLHAVQLERQIATYPDGLLDELQWLDWSKEDSALVSTLFCSTEGQTWAIRVRATTDLGGKLELYLAVSEPGRRVSSAWNTPKSQAFMLRSQHLSSQHQKFQRRWEAGKAEGYPSMTRFYGMASYKDFRALHISFHPRTVIEYQIAAREISLILFSHKSLEQSTVDATALEFDWENAILPEVSTDGIEVVWNHILKNVDFLETNKAEYNPSPNLYSRIVQLYLSQAFLNGWQLPASIILVERLAQRTFDQVALDNIEEKREDASSEEALRYIEEVLGSMLGELRMPEKCSICNEHLEWNDESSAICQQGHQYDRCSLTLLAIQEPGVTKHCGSCNREYLDDKLLVKNRENSDPLSRQALVNLFDTFAKCIFCDGFLQSFS